MAEAQASTMDEAALVETYVNDLPGAEQISHSDHLLSPVAARSVSSTFREVALRVEIEIAESGHLRPLAGNCLGRPLAATCGHLRPLAATCGHLRPLAATCGHSLGAATCSHLRPLEWLRVAASGCE